MIYLASRSPRRAKLLRQIGVEFSVHTIDVDESRRDGEAPATYVSRLAESKARAAAEALSLTDADYRVLAADTTIAIDGDIIGKPADAGGCRCILERLSRVQAPSGTAWAGRCNSTSSPTPEGVTQSLV